MELWVDGTLRLSRPYTDFVTPASGFAAGFYFGAHGFSFPPIIPVSVTSEWDYVLYEIGSSRP